jgi:hypothetical protein
MKKIFLCLSETTNWTKYRLMVLQIRFLNFNQKLNMKNNTLKFGLGLGLGVYIYEVFNNLLQHQPLSSALTDVDWKRVIFIGVFGSVVSYFVNKKSDSK